VDLDWNWVGNLKSIGGWNSLDLGPNKFDFDVLAYWTLSLARMAPQGGGTVTFPAPPILFCFDVAPFLILPPSLNIDV
jgi:hypothetical protein